MTAAEDFRARYGGALRTYLAAPGEASLAVGHELGRQALQERISMLEIIENHFRLVEKLATNSTPDGAAALQFLLQTLAALDVATRGFLDGTRRYAQQRARADDLAHRDQFHTALVNSLQEGFFVADREGVIIEINDAFTQITGYPADGLPYRRPYPWNVDDAAVNERLSRLVRDGHVEAETPIRHANGHTEWVAVSINAVTGDAHHDAYVGTLRDITAARAAAAREGAVARLAAAVGIANSVSEVLQITLDQCRDAIDVRRVVAVMWPSHDSDPAVHVAGTPPDTTWRELDPFLRTTLEVARHWLPLTVEPVAPPDDHGLSRGIVAVLSGTGDVALWLEHTAPRRFDTPDRVFVGALAARLGLAIQHVRQFEAARDTSLALQRAILSPMEPPDGFAVRYEPAVQPLEIGGDWYDVLRVGDHQIGIIVGDCVGRGLSAAAVMGQLRSSARALLVTGAEPALVLEHLDSAASLIPGAFFTTVFVAVFDTDSRALRYSSAGHLPAVMATPRSPARLLADALSVPLAVQREHPRPQAGDVLTPGSTLMVFTDGLVERRHGRIDEGIARVAAILTASLDSTVDAIADAVLREMAPPEGYEDDVAIVVCRPPDAPLRLETEATVKKLTDVRHRLAAWLRGRAIPDPLSSDIVLAVNEACTNSAEHAYRGRQPETMRVEAQIGDTELRVRIVDFGCWQPSAAEPGVRGRGLPLMRALSDWVEIDRTATGSTVEMAFRLPGAGSSNTSVP